MNEITLLRQIATAAATVRDRQRTYFKTRAREVLIRSKDAEKQLDALLRQHHIGDFKTDLQDDLFQTTPPARPP